MLRYTLVYFCVLLFTTVSLPQDLQDYYKKVEKKLLVDKKYLNIYNVSYQPKQTELDSLLSIPRSDGAEPYNFIMKENVTYSIIFMKDNLELDSIILLNVKKIEDKAASGESFFGDASTGPQIDTTTVLNFKDLQELFFNNDPHYTFLYNRVVEANSRDEAVSMLGIDITDKETKSRGVTSPDNQDFISFFRANGIHRFPTIADETKTQRRTRRTTETTVESEFQIDASFSHVSFFHKAMDFGFGTISAELNLGSKSLNLTPWMVTGLNVGLRTLLSLSGDVPDLKNDFLIDAKIMGRMGLNLSNVVENIPFVFASKPLLNVGSGIILDISGTRSFGLPFFNFYIATGSTEYKDPYIKFGRSDSSIAYFTTKQVEATFSFYWNTSEDKSIRFKMDLGVGNYNVYKGTYTSTISKDLLYNKIKPVVAVSMNFAPKNNEFLGTQVRFYDNILNLNLWMKMIEFAPSHLFRFETSFYSAPMFRNLYQWESEGGSSIVQIRYRYGF